MGKRVNCKHCGKKKPAPPKTNYVKREVYEADEFCSAKCCRKFHGVEWLSGSSSVYPEDGMGEAA